MNPSSTKTKNIQESFLDAVEFPGLLEKLAGDCQTPSGKDHLKSFRPVQDGPLVEARLAKTGELEKFLSARAHSAEAGFSVPDPQYFKGAFERAREKGEVFSGEELSAFLQFLSQVVRLRRFFSADREIPPVFQEWLGRLNTLPEFKEEWRSKVSDKGEIVDSASTELQRLREKLRSLRADVQNFYQSFLQGEGTAEALQEKIVTEREGRMVVPVKRGRQSAVPGLLHGMSASGSTLFIEPREIVESNNQVREALLEEDEEIRRILREATLRILDKAREVAETLEACAEIDAHATLALFASRFDGQFLAPKPGSALRLMGARHPLLALEAGDQFREKVVPLDLEYQDGVRVILVSGPNAGGKTVALKTLGLSCAMAQSGLPVLARPESDLPFLVHFDSDLLDGQNLEDHLSTYAAKLRALKRMADQAAPGCLFLLDELGAGTDPREGGALGLACLEAFREKGAFVLANTHQPLLKLLAQEEKGMANAAMLFDEKTGKPTFRMASGVPGRSYALTLARQFGFSEGILRKAEGHLPPGEADISEALAKLGTERQAAEKARVEAEKTRDQVKKLEAELLIARRQMKDEARRIKKEAQVEAEGLLKNTRRQMEHLIQGVEPPPGETADKDKIKSARLEVNQKLRHIAPRPVRQIVEVRDLKEGEPVFFKPGQCEVKVLSADEEKEEAAILMPNGVKLSCKYSDLGRISKAAPPSRPPVPRPGPPGVLGGAGLDEKGRLDLDLRGKMVDQALPLLDKFLDDALLVDLPFVRIIHGKGTGALREAVHKHLPAHYPDVEFSLAEPAQGGAGVTVVKFKKT